METNLVPDRDPCFLLPAPPGSRSDPQKRRKPGESPLPGFQVRFYATPLLPGPCTAIEAPLAGADQVQTAPNMGGKLRLDVLRPCCRHTIRFTSGPTASGCRRFVHLRGHQLVLVKMYGGTFRPRQLLFQLILPDRCWPGCMCQMRMLLGPELRCDLHLDARGKIRSL